MHTHTHTHWCLPFPPSPLCAAVIVQKGPNALNAHQPYLRGFTQIAVCIFQAKQVNYFSGLFSFFFLFTLPLQREGPCGMDVMRWSTGEAIYPQFVPLRSFKNANCLKADWASKTEREREREQEPTSSSFYMKWIELVKVERTVSMISVSLNWGALKTCIQYLMDSHMIKGKEGGQFRAGVPQQDKWEVKIGRSFAFGRRQPMHRVMIGAVGHLIPGNQQLQMDG